MQKAAAIMMLVMMSMAVATFEGMAAQGAAQTPSAEVPDPAAGLPPQAVFPETEYHFAPILEGRDVEHDFFVENKGRGDLIIESVRPD